MYIDIICSEGRRRLASIDVNVDMSIRRLEGYI